MVYIADKKDVAGRDSPGEHAEEGAQCRRRRLGVVPEDDDKSNQYSQKADSCHDPRPQRDGAYFIGKACGMVIAYLHFRFPLARVTGLPKFLYVRQDECPSQARASFRSALVPSRSKRNTLARSGWKSRVAAPATPSCAT